MTVVTSIPQKSTRHGAHAKTRHLVADDQSSVRVANRYLTRCGRNVFGWTDDRVGLFPVTCKSCIRSTTTEGSAR